MSREDTAIISGGIELLKSEFCFMSEQEGKALKQMKRIIIKNWSWRVDIVRKNSAW